MGQYGTRPNSETRPFVCTKADLAMTLSLYLSSTFSRTIVSLMEGRGTIFWRRVSGTTSSGGVRETIFCSAKTAMTKSTAAQGTICARGTTRSLDLSAGAFREMTRFSGETATTRCMEREGTTSSMVERAMTSFQEPADCTSIVLEILGM